MKRCPRCSTNKTAQEFSKSNASKDGLASYCKECAKSYSKERHAKQYVGVFPKKKSDGLYHCRHCNQYFEEDDMHKSKNSGYLSMTYCKACNPVVRNMRQIGKYGITVDQYMEILKEQNYSCKICGKDEASYRKRLSVDHDHNCCPGEGSCGRCIRGLLCHHCNAGLGNVRDDIEVLQKMIDYLKSGYIEVN